jgi:hypothetical protein
MAIPSQQIGYGTEEKLLWQISKQLESLTGATYNSKKTLLNVASGDNAGAKIETYSGAWTGIGNSGDPFFVVDINQVQGLIFEYSLFIPETGQGYAGTTWVSGFNDGGKYYLDYGVQTDNGEGASSINSNNDGSIYSFYCNAGAGNIVQFVYTVKLFTVPLYNA